MEARKNIIISLEAEHKGKKWPVSFEADYMSEELTRGRITEGRGLGITIAVFRYYTSIFGSEYGVFIPEYNAGVKLQAFEGTAIACTADEIKGIIDNVVDRQTAATVINHIVLAMAQEENERISAMIEKKH